MNASLNIHEQFAFFFKDKRIQAYAYLLSKKMAEGHICLDLKNDSLSDELVGTLYENSILDTNFLLDSKHYYVNKHSIQNSVMDIMKTAAMMTR